MLTAPSPPLTPSAHSADDADSVHPSPSHSPCPSLSPFKPPLPQPTFPLPIDLSLFHPLAFPLPCPTPVPTPVPPLSRKRRRPTTHIASESPLPSKKKRRLRLMLITSRLSRPFSTPASHIVDHGRSRVAMWAKTKRVGGMGALRKAAILNRARLEGWASPRGECVEDLDEDLGDTEDLVAGVADIAMGLIERQKSWKKKPAWVNDVDIMDDVRGGADEFGFGGVLMSRSSKWPGAPSPLGLSNYDALDEDLSDAVADEEAESSPSPQGGMGRGKSRLHKIKTDEVYSDFNLLDDPNRPDDETYNAAFSILPPEMDLLKRDRPPSPPDEQFVDLFKGKRGSGEGFFVVT